MLQKATENVPAATESEWIIENVTAQYKAQHKRTTSCLENDIIQGLSMAADRAEETEKMTDRNCQLERFTYQQCHVDRDGITAI